MGTPLPPHASIHKWKLLPEILLRALFNPLVVVTIMTAVSLVIGVLAITSKPVSKQVLWICVLIGLFGLVAIVYEVERLRGLDIAKTLINNLLVEGDHLTLYVFNTSDAARRYPINSPANTVDDHEYYVLMLDWCGREPLGK